MLVLNVGIRYKSWSADLSIIIPQILRWADALCSGIATDGFNKAFPAHLPTVSYCSNINHSSVLLWASLLISRLCLLYLAPFTTPLSGPEGFPPEPFFFAPRYRQQSGHQTTFRLPPAAVCICMLNKCMILPEVSFLIYIFEQPWITNRCKYFKYSFHFNGSVHAYAGGRSCREEQRWEDEGDEGAVKNLPSKRSSWVTIRPLNGIGRL